MPIHVLDQKATEDQIAEMLKALDHYIKVAVDVERKCLAGGGIMHADCEAILLKEGSKQENIWGADWYPKERRVEFNSLINIRPRQGNRKLEIQSQDLRSQVERIVRKILEK